MVVITDNQGKPRLDAVMAQLADEGMTSVMVEAGGRFVAALLAAGLVDRLVWMRSSSIIGGDGLASLGDLGLTSLAGGVFFTAAACQRLVMMSLKFFIAAPEPSICHVYRHYHSTRYY